MSKLLIIGNGFDLDIGYETSYKQFLASKNFPQPKIKYGLIYYLKSKYNINKWIDLETEIKFFAEDKVYFLDDSVYLPEKNQYIPHQAIKGNTNFLRDELDYLSNSLFVYIKNIEQNINTNSVAANILRNLILHEDYNIISFNYTSLLYIAEKIGISKQISYKHVHGSVEKGSIILGIEDEAELSDNNCFCIKSHHPSYRSCNINELLEQSDEIILFGLSLGITDYHYFKDFFLKQSGNTDEKPKNKKIRIFTFDEQSRLDFLLQLRKMNNNGTNKLYDLNDLQMYKTGDENDRKDISQYYDELATVKKRFNSFSV